MWIDAARTENRITSGDIVLHLYKNVRSCVLLRKGQRVDVTGVSLGLFVCI